VENPSGISAILDEALALHDNRIEVAGIEVLRNYDATAKFRCHVGELRQVIVKLMGNAIDAMPFGRQAAVESSQSNRWEGRSPRRVYYDRR
jgi:signal transduction histidine kinase